MRRDIGPVVALGVLLACGCGEPAMKEFSSASGKFKVLMPGTPAQKVESVAGMSMKTYTVTQANGLLGVKVIDNSPFKGEAEAMIQKRLDGAVQGAVGNARAKLTSVSNIKLQEKYPGRELQAELSEQRGLVRARIYITDTHFYQIIALGTKEWATSADVTKFLDSFDITP